MRCNEDGTSGPSLLSKSASKHARFAKHLGFGSTGGVSGRMCLVPRLGRGCLITMCHSSGCRARGCVEVCAQQGAAVVSACRVAPEAEEEAGRLLAQQEVGHHVVGKLPAHIPADAKPGQLCHISDGREVRQATLHRPGCQGGSAKWPGCSKMHSHAQPNEQPCTGAWGQRWRRGCAPSPPNVLEHRVAVLPPANDDGVGWQLLQLLLWWWQGLLKARAWLLLLLLPVWILGRRAGTRLRAQLSRYPVLALHRLGLLLLEVLALGTVLSCLVLLVLRVLLRRWRALRPRVALLQCRRLRSTRTAHESKRVDPRLLLLQ